MPFFRTIITVPLLKPKRITLLNLMAQPYRRPGKIQPWKMALVNPKILMITLPILFIP